MSNPTDPESTPAVETENPTVDELQADRDATRERLAASVEALMAKTDVKAQAKQKAEETTDQIKVGARDLLARVQQLPPAAQAAIAVGVTALLVLAIRSRRRG